MTGSQRSLAKGSAAPGPVPEGVIRIYGMRFCPYVQRAILVLVAKGIKHEVVNINLKNKPDWFFEKSPLGLVPSIETSDDKIIYESLIICDYLDEAFPGVKLTPADPYEKAQQKILLEQFNEVLTKRNIPYLGGESLSMIDYMIWPWFERLHVSDITEVLEKMPRINAWYKLMLQDPAVKQTFSQPDVISGFTHLYFKDDLDAVDYGLD
ncbi:glutathione S-transferase omega-1-like isoform X4 [Bufo bufo]|uniref:glutathione S-transferase omega-1-like isoform X4 n=1 Tax=Bufo bufo TaxID=8384 RepID=UPI001ABDA6E6|nr:glutathione S-transferase omega-1-like isoform X4 [Bufo bufo]